MLVEDGHSCALLTLLKFSYSQNIFQHQKLDPRLT